MIPIEWVKEHYSTMMDEELIELANNPEDITYEAVLALKKELRRRNLPSHLIKILEEKTSKKKIDKIRDKINTDNENYTTKVLLIAINNKINKASDNDIINDLIKEGLEPETAAYIVVHLQDIGKNSLIACSKNMKIGCGVCLGGILFILFIVQNSSSVSLSVYFFLGSAILTGAIRFFTAESSYQKYHLLLQILEEEKKNLSTR
jgi:hypothetical protein